MTLKPGEIPDNPLAKYAVRKAVAVHEALIVAKQAAEKYGQQSQQCRDAFAMKRHLEAKPVTDFLEENSNEKH